MKKYVVAFGNALEAITWKSNNCDVCENTNCYSKRIMKLAHISGETTWKEAWFIGVKRLTCSSDMNDNDTCTLKARCDNFDKKKYGLKAVKKDINQLTIS